MEMVRNSVSKLSEAVDKDMRSKDLDDRPWSFAAHSMEPGLFRSLANASFGHNNVRP